MPILNPSQEIPFSLFLLTRELERLLCRSDQYIDLPILFESIEGKITYEKRYFLLEWEQVNQENIYYWISSVLDTMTVQVVIPYLKDKFPDLEFTLIKKEQCEFQQIQIANTELPKLSKQIQYPDRESTTMLKSTGLTIYEKIARFNARLLHNRINPLDLNPQEHNFPDYFIRRTWSSIENYHFDYMVASNPFRAMKTYYSVRLAPHPQNILSRIHISFVHMFKLMNTLLNKWRNDFYKDMFKIALLYKYSDNEVSKNMIVLLAFQLLNNKDKANSLMVTLESLILVTTLAFSNVLNGSDLKVLPAKEKKSDLFKFFSSSLPEQRREKLTNDDRDILIFQ